MARPQDERWLVRNLDPTQGGSHVPRGADLVSAAHHADVPADVGGNLRTDCVEPVEDFWRPIDHLTIRQRLHEVAKGVEDLEPAC